MSYTSKSDLLELFSAQELQDLTDIDDPALGAINDTRLNAAIAAVSSEIDGYVGKRYQLPLSIIPATLKDIAGRLVFAALHRREINDKAAADAKTARLQLRDIANGLLVLDADGASPTEPNGGGVVVEGPDRLFSRDTMGSF